MRHFQRGTARPGHGQGLFETICPEKNLIDAGPIVAYLTDEAHHDWAAEQFSRFDSFETCEAACSACEINQ